MAYPKNQELINEAIAELRALKDEKDPVYPDLPDLPPIPKAADEVVAIVTPKRKTT